MLKKLRARLGAKKGKEPAPGTNPKVLWQGGNKNPSMGGNAPKPAENSAAAYPSKSADNAAAAYPAKKEEPKDAAKY